jgi:hypothetical protein
MKLSIARSGMGVPEASSTGACRLVVLDATGQESPFRSDRTKMYFDLYIRSNSSVYSRACVA